MAFYSVWSLQRTLAYDDLRHPELLCDARTRGVLTRSGLVLHFRSEGARSGRTLLLLTRFHALNERRGRIRWIWAVAFDKSQVLLHRAAGECLEHDTHRAVPFAHAHAGPQAGLHEALALPETLGLGVTTDDAKP